MKFIFWFYHQLDKSSSIFTVCSLLHSYNNHIKEIIHQAAHCEFRATCKAKIASVPAWLGIKCVRWPFEEMLLCSRFISQEFQIIIVHLQSECNCNSCRKWQIFYGKESALSLKERWLTNCWGILKLLYVKSIQSNLFLSF